VKTGKLEETTYFQTEKLKQTIDNRYENLNLALK